MVLEVAGSNPAVRPLIIYLETIKTLKGYLNIKSNIGRFLLRNLKIVKLFLLSISKN